MLEGKSEKLWVPKDVELTLLEDKNEQEQTRNAEKETKREIENQRKMNEKREINEKTMENDLSWNDPWSDHPETQFGPTYPFFRSPEPRPTLCT